MKHIHCPVNGHDCPYYTDKGHPCRCILAHPEEECDDFLVFWDPIEDDGDWLDDDWNPCIDCNNWDQDTPEKAACCNCCEVGEFFSSSPKNNLKKHLTKFR